VFYRVVAPWLLIFINTRIWKKFILSRYDRSKSGRFGFPMVIFGKQFESGFQKVH
jgi:hypothetical protein